LEKKLFKKPTIPMALMWELIWAAPEEQVLTSICTCISFPAGTAIPISWH